MAKRINPYNKTLAASIPCALMEYKRLSDGAKLLYARLVMYAGQNGLCYPAIETLAKDLAKSPRTIINLLTELKIKGFIEWESPPKRKRIAGKTNKYFFLDHPVIVAAIAQGKTAPHVKNLLPAYEESFTSPCEKSCISPYEESFTQRDNINTRDNIRDSGEEIFTWPDESQAKEDKPCGVALKPETPKTFSLTKGEIKDLTALIRKKGQTVTRITRHYRIKSLAELTLNQFEEIKGLSDYSNYDWDYMFSTGG
jgi:hypothetical protein